MSASRGETSSYYQDDFNLTCYIHVLDENKGGLVLNQFMGTSYVLRAGTVDQSRYICNERLSPGC